MSDTTPDTISAAERLRLLIAQRKAGTAARRSGRYGKRPLDAMSAAERRRILIERKAAAKAQRERGDALHIRRIEAVGGANPEIEPATVSVNEFVVLSGVAHATIFRWIKRGVIRSVMIGGRRLIPFSEVRRLRGEG
jgi:excisionase family DNA binding protein